MKKKSMCYLFKGVILVLILMAFLMEASPRVYASGELNVGWLSTDMLESTKMSSAWHFEAQGSMYWQLIYDQMWLLGPKQDYALVPWAVTKYESADRVKWRFILRPDMKFHDGKPVTAEDLAFTIEYLAASDPTWQFNDAVTKEGSVVVIDDHTVEFELAMKLGHQYVPFQFYPIIPKHIWKRHKFDMIKFDNKKAIGSGPFKLKEFKAGKYIIFEKFNDHWNKNDSVDKIVFKPYGGNDLLNMALKRGEIDMLGYAGISPLAIKYFDKSSDIELIQSPGMELIWLTFNLYPEGPVRDINIRKAIAHTLDKDNLIKLVYHGYAKAEDSFIYSELPEYNLNLPKYEFDVAKANKLLDDAGYMDSDDDGIRNNPATKKNIRLRFLTPTWAPECVKIATLFKEHMKPIGLDVDIMALDSDTYFDIYYYPQGNGFDVAYASGEPGPYSDWIWEFMRGIDRGGVGRNTAYYNNDEFDDLMDMLFAEEDMDNRKKISDKMQEILIRDLPHLVLCRPEVIHPVRTDKLEGYEQRYMGGITSWINPFSYYNVHAKE